MSVTDGKKPGKRLALFLDGTWNAVGTNTNVWRLRCLCADKSADGTIQLRYYDQGVNGTIGGGWGRGLSDNVCQAYDWILEHYDEGDEIFIVGFSRGAYTARSLAGLIATCGLLRQGGPLGVNQLFDRYRRADNNRTIYRLRDGDSNPSTEETWLLKYSRETPIKMVGVWDTVGALGLPVLRIPGISSSTFGFHHTGLRRPIQHGFHAVAIDENRRKFAPTLWTVRTPPNQAPSPMRPVDQAEQRWFIGAHANVGGGYYDDLLAQIPLNWMMRKAEQCGLAFREAVKLDGTEQLGSISDSYRKFLWGAYSRFVGRHYRPIGAAPTVREDGTHANVNETIDATVFERWRSDPNYRPFNLKQWAAQKNVEPADVHTSVSAIDPILEVAG